MRQSSALAVLGLSVLSVLMAASEPKGLEKIAAYNGTWEFEVEHFQTAHSPKTFSEASTLENQCWATEGYYVCNQFMDGRSRALLVFTYNEKDDTYDSYPIPHGGKDATHGKLIIKDYVWTFPWEDTKDGKTTYYRVVNVFKDAKTIEYRQEYSEDKEHWTVMAKGTEHKQPAPRK